MRLLMHGGYLFITSQLLPKIHPKSPSAMDFGTPESFSYGQYSKCADLVE